MSACKGMCALCCLISYAAEEAIQKLEKEKQQQDYLVDDLQVRGGVCAGPAAVACVCDSVAAPCY